MGFFSFDCVECGHPMLSPYVLNPTNAWMNEVVVHEDEIRVLYGSYDGYGRVAGETMDLSGDACCRHRACWEAAGKPGHTGPSELSDDQGYFFDDGAHDMEKPDEHTVPEDPDGEKS